LKGKWVRKPQNNTSVIFVHGILSDGEKCWQNDSGAYWPNLLKNEKEFKNIGIWIFTYNTGIFSGTYNIGDAVDSLWSYMKLDHVFNHSKKLVFVCHSMGGIVARRLIVQHQLDFSKQKKCLGLFLVASPSLGSKYANWLSLLTGMTGHTQAKSLKISQHNVWLNDLDKDFLNLKEADNPGFIIRGKELIEDKPLIIKKLYFIKQIVEPFSGARYFGDSYKVPRSDHSSIAKPENSNAIQHRLLCEFIIEMLNNGSLHSTIENRNEMQNQMVDKEVTNSQNNEVNTNVTNNSNVTTIVGNGNTIQPPSSPQIEKPKKILPVLIVVILLFVIIILYYSINRFIIPYYVILDGDWHYYTSLSWGECEKSLIRKEEDESEIWTFYFKNRRIKTSAKERDMDVKWNIKGINQFSYKIVHKGDNGIAVKENGNGTIDMINHTIKGRWNVPSLNQQGCFELEKNN